MLLRGIRRRNDGLRHSVGHLRAHIGLGVHGGVWARVDLGDCGGRCAHVAVGLPQNKGDALLVAVGARVGSITGLIVALAHVRILRFMTVVGSSDE